MLPARRAGAALFAPGLRRCPLTALSPLPLGTGRAGPSCCPPWGPRCPRAAAASRAGGLARALRCGLERAPSRWGRGRGHGGRQRGAEVGYLGGWGRRGLHVACSNQQRRRNLEILGAQGGGSGRPYWWTRGVCAPEPPAPGRSGARPLSLGRSLQGCGLPSSSPYALRWKPFSAARDAPILLYRGCGGIANIHGYSRV